MNSEATKIYVRPASGRPDFRVVLAFLWPEGQNLDTDGNSNNPASRTWTELYICNRENEAEVVDCAPVNEAPLTLKIESEQEYLAARLAWFLSTETDGLVSLSSEGPFVDADILKAKLGDKFHITEALQRAQGSKYNRSTLDNPYPSDLSDDT